jgi:hypothetical protein
MELVTVAYLSYATREMSDQDLKDLLVKARAKNRKDNITGMLLYRDKVFLQVLEGEQEIVEAMLKVICNDPRHHNVTVIYRTGIGQRAFADWQMGFNYVDEKVLREVEGYSNFLAKPTPHNATHSQSMVRALLESFRTRSAF